MDSSIAILVVEDDPDIKPILEETLADGGFEVTVATSGEEAIALLTANKSDYRKHPAKTARGSFSVQAA